MTVLETVREGVRGVGELYRLSGVVKDYGLGRPALGGVDLTIARGSFVAIVGPSGSGKSTLLHLLGALDRATAGDIRLGDQRLDELDDRQRTLIRRHHVGFVFQQYNLLPVLSAHDNVALPLVVDRVGREEVAERVAAALETVGLADVGHQRPAELSGGQQQRVAIARALVTEPDVVLADEPTGALDTDTGREVIAALRHVCDTAGTTVVLATHDPVAASAADEVVRLRDGLVAGREVLERRPLDSVFASDEADPVAEL